MRSLPPKLACTTTGKWIRWLCIFVLEQTWDFDLSWREDVEWKEMCIVLAECWTCEGVYTWVIGQAQVIAEHEEEHTRGHIVKQQQHKLVLRLWKCIIIVGIVPEDEDKDVKVEINTFETPLLALLNKSIPFQLWRVEGMKNATCAACTVRVGMFLAHTDRWEICFFKVSSKTFVTCGSTYTDRSTSPIRSINQSINQSISQSVSFNTRSISSVRLYTRTVTHYCYLSLLSSLSFVELEGRIILTYLLTWQFVLIYLLN